jgi:hypothetical protein
MVIGLSHVFGAVSAVTPLLNPAWALSRGVHAWTCECQAVALAAGLHLLRASCQAFRQVPRGVGHVFLCVSTLWDWSPITVFVDLVGLEPYHCVCFTSSL